MKSVPRLFIRMHTLLLQKTKGRRFNMGGSLLILHTVGARSGKPRSNPLMKLPHGDGYIIAASAAGADVHPGWYHNIVNTPDVEIELDGERLPMRARVAEGEERDALYREFIAFDSRFERYQNKTSRTIPIVVLEPRE